MKFFDLNNVPKTVSWIKKLTIEEAREQCKLWGIKPKDKLDAMRVQLSEFVARSSEGVVSDLEESADEPRVPVTDDLVDNPSLKQDEVGTCTVLPPVVPVDLGGLVKKKNTDLMSGVILSRWSKEFRQPFGVSIRVLKWPLGSGVEIPGWWRL
ncbi:hypothetical protein J6590_067417 [Homalodisca vitripennis]|nr:hypothetical protein J6590_067417 [Homalodisca vitripennis]